MSEFEREDMELEAMMGDKFHDATREPVKAESKKVSKDTTTARKPRQEAKDAIWSPFNAEPSFTQKLMDCAKWGSLYGSLYLLFYYWQCTGQMQPSAAFPAMTVCAMLVGWSFGKYAFRGERK